MHLNSVSKNKRSVSEIEPHDKAYWRLIVAKIDADKEILECIKEGFEVNVRAGGDGVVATVVAVGAVRVSASASGEFDHIGLAVGAAKAELKKALSRR